MISAYLVTLAVLIPASGWVAARYGARPVILAAIAIFTAASIGCAASTSLPELVAMRIAQGVGGALMVPVGRQVVLADTPKEELMAVISFLIWPALVAPVFAPLLGGVLTDYASWHWIFLINVPLGALAFAAALRLIESPPVERPPRLGVLLTCLGLGGLTYAADLLAQPSTDWVLAAVIAGAAALSLLLAVRHLLGAPSPLVNLRTLAFVDAGTSLAVIGLFVLAGGVARSIGLTGYSTLAFSEVPEPMMPDANVLQVTTQQLCAGMGAAVGAVALRIGAAIEPGLEGSFRIAFLFLAGLSPAAAIGAMRLDRSAGDVLRAARHRPADAEEMVG